MIKNIIIPTSGPILPLLGGVYGPILHPFPIDVRDIPPIIIQNHTVKEYLRNGRYVALNLYNYDKPLDASGPTIQSIGNDDKRDYVVTYGDSFEIPVPIVLKNHEGVVNVTTEITYRGGIVEGINTQTPGLYTITYRATDSMGAVSEPASIKLVVLSEEDISNPVIKYSGPTLFYAIYGSKFALPVVKAFNSKEEEIPVVQTIQYKNAPVQTINTEQSGQYDVEYNSTDLNGQRSAPLQFTVHVGEEPDRTIPVIDYSGPTEVVLFKGQPYEHPYLKAIDNKDGDIPTTVSINLNGNTSVTRIDTQTSGVYTVTYTARDKSDNYAIPVIIVVTVLSYTLDEVPPVIEYSGQTNFVVNYGGEFILPQLTATDNVDSTIEVTHTITLNDLPTSAVDTHVTGTYIVTYSAQDSSGNQATPVVITVTVGNHTIPVINYVGETEFNVEYGGPFNIPTVTATDYKGGEIQATYTITLSDRPVGSVDTTVLGVYSIIYTATDDTTASATIRITVTVADTIKPTFTYSGSTNLSIDYGSVFTVPVVTATDNKDSSVAVIHVVTRNNLEIPAVDTSTPALYVITYTARDLSNNVATMTINVTVGEQPDTAAPVLVYTGQTSFTVEYAGSFTEPVVTATDNKDSEVTVTKVVKRGTGVVSSVDTRTLGTYTITYTASDIANNQATPVVITVNVVDTTKPVFNYTTPTDINVDFGSEYTLPTVTANDAKDGSVSVTRVIKLADVVKTSVDTGVSGTYVVTHTAKDTSNNTATLVLNVTVGEQPDTTAPVLVYTGQTSFTVEYAGSFTEPTVTATDNKDSSVSVTKVVKRGTDVVSSVDTRTLGTYTITYSAKDAANNNATPVVITVNVVDTTKPVFNYTTPTDISVDFGAEYTLPTITATDNKDSSVSVTRVIKLANVVKETVDTRVSGRYVVTHTAKDTSNNTATLVLNVTVGEEPDTTPPVIEYVGEHEVELVFGSDYTLPTATATDNKDTSVTVTRTVLFEDAPVDNVDTEIPGIYEIKFTAKDAANNQATPVSVLVTVAEEVADPPVE